MTVEMMIYIYLFVCASMIGFNVVAALLFHHKDQKAVRVSERFYDDVQLQLQRIQEGGHSDAGHQKYLCRKLKRVGNMVAFDKMLEATYINNPTAVKQYLSELDSVFIALCAHYCGRNRIEAAYFPYIIKKYRVIAFRVLPSITEALLSMLNEPSLYCRENAMQALYTTGDCECVIKALKKIDRSDLFYHGKLISDGLLHFSGNNRQLVDRLVAQFDQFSTEMQVNLLNYIRFSSADYCAFALSLLCDENRNDEVRYSAIRYLGKYRFDNAYPTLCALSSDRQAERWQYSAIASSALSNYPGDETVALLKRNLYSRNWYIRFNSAESLERLGITYSQLADILDGDDRYAAEIIRYRLQQHERSTPCHD